MIHQINRYLLFLLLAAGIFSSGKAKSQTIPNDSLTLNSIISEVIQNHPLVKIAMEDLKVADAKIGLAESNYLPSVIFESSYARIGPISGITIAGLESFYFMPHDNYSAALNVNQTIYDFGKTEKNVLLEKQGKELYLQSIEQVKQKLSQVVIVNYFALVYLQEALKIKDEQLSTLNEHLRFIQKKQETGSATQYEILTTQVRISNIENQKTDLETACLVQVNQLKSLLGKPESTTRPVKNELIISLPYQQNNAVIVALQNREEMKLAAQKAKLGKLRFSLTAAQYNPVFNAFLSSGIKNGYFPYLNDPKANFVAGIGVRIPILSGKRNKYNLIQAQSAIQVIDQETEIVRRAIMNEVVEDKTNVKASQKKVEQGELQLKQATQAYSLAKFRFESGVITNLELLEGSTAVSESRLQLLKAKIDFTVNLYKLKAAIGEKLY